MCDVADMDYYGDEGGYGGGYGGDHEWVYIKSSMNGKVLDVDNNSTNPGAHVNMYSQKKPNEGADNQLFYIDDATQTIRSKLNDFCLDLDGGVYKN